MDRKSIHSIGQGDIGLIDTTEVTHFLHLFRFIRRQHKLSFDAACCLIELTTGVIDNAARYHILTIEHGEKILRMYYRTISDIKR